MLGKTAQGAAEVSLTTAVISILPKHYFTNTDKHITTQQTSLKKTQPTKQKTPKFFY